MQGARWVQREILEKYPEAEFQIYAVWFDVLLGDDRSAWNPDLLVDSRVTEYWDSDRTLGEWFPRQEGYDPVVFGPLAWDIFFLYGPEVVWEDAPTPLITSGNTIIAKRERLRSGLSKLLAGDNDD